MIASVNLTIAAGSDAKEPWQIEAERQRITAASRPADSRVVAGRRVKL